MRLLMLATSLCCAMATNAVAQTINTCGRLLDQGIRDITRKESGEHAVAYKYSRYCGIDFEKASDEAVRNADIVVFGYGAGKGNDNSSATRTKLKEWCNTNKAYSEGKEYLVEEAAIVNAELMQSFDRCVEMARKDIFLDVVIQGSEAQRVVISIDSTHDGDLAYLGTHVRGFVCEEDMVSSASQEQVAIEAQPKIRNSNIHISCTRSDPMVKEVGGLGSIAYEAGYIQVTTSGPVMPLYFSEVVSNYGVTPPGGIMAFETECPAGWSPHTASAGRTLVSSGQGTDLTERMPGEMGGQEAVTLTISQMPRHDHGGETQESGVQFMNYGSKKGRVAGRLAGDTPFYVTEHSHSIPAQGKGAEHENMPPFLVVNYCKRDAVTVALSGPADKEAAFLTPITPIVEEIKSDTVNVAPAATSAPAVDQ